MIQQIKADLLQARKTDNVAEKTLLSTLLGEAVNIGKNDGNRDTTDSEARATIRKFIKNIDETLGYVNADSALKLESEKVILTRYLPVGITNEALTEIVTALVEALPEKNAKQMGTIMGQLNQQYPDLYDRKFASTLIKTLLV